MELTKPGDGIQAACDAVLGYLNFSSGVHDPQFFRGLNDLFRQVAARINATKNPRMGSESPGVAGSVLATLQDRLTALRDEKEVFAESRQAACMLQALERFIPAYFEFHRDLLFHQTADDIFGPFFLGSVCESLLRQQPPWEDPATPVESAIRQLDDFVGYRPIPVLESHRIEPHSHERVRPVPLFLIDADTAFGQYEPLIRGALQILRQTDSDLCSAMGFQLTRLAELSFDPRAYDFDHPVNRRPNYHFGEWDPHQLDTQGYYCRFVIREVTLQALLARVELADRLRIAPDELLWEASTVLAGTILMASAVSGDHPGAHDSSVTLGKLVTQIARYRDEFYDRWIHAVSGPHGERLRREARVLHQPFGGTRHHLNTHLARQRARQLERVRLAKVFARMGYMNAAQRQADSVQVASARIICRIDCRLTACDHAVRRGEHQGVLDHLDHIFDLLRRGIDCGAMVDPWNILGFEGNFSLFPALENTTHDHRVDDLLRLVDRTFDVMARLWSNAAANADEGTCRGVRVRYEEFASWWNQFAAHEISAVEVEPPLEGLNDARHVSAALGEWKRSGAASGDIGFWAPHVEGFSNPKPYALVVETLMAHDDLVGSMSLLVHWLSQAERVSLEARSASFHDGAVQWVRRVGSLLIDGDDPTTPIEAGDRQRYCQLLCKFFDYLEANADALWEVPHFRLGDPAAPRRSRSDAPHTDHAAGDDEPSDGLFEAAYENVVYRDSTDDGMESALFEHRPADEEDWDQEVERCRQRLMFLFTLGRLWRAASVALARAAAMQPFEDRTAVRIALSAWRDRASANREALLSLMDEVAAVGLQRDGTDIDAMARYHRQRMHKESLLEQSILTYVKTASAEMALQAAEEVVAGDGPVAPPAGADPTTPQTIGDELACAAQLIASALRGDRTMTAALARQLVATLPSREVLYTPLARGGEPRRIAEVRTRHQYLQDILVALPRLGLIQDTLHWIETIRAMESNVPQGRGAITQFDDMFESGFRELVELLVRSTGSGQRTVQSEDQDADTVLIHYLERLAENALAIWLRHSQSLRLSILERVRSPAHWKRLVTFIETYGGDIFTQDFLHPGNIRAILHYGPECWLRDLAADDDVRPLKLLDDLDHKIPREEAAQWLGLILEAVSESYDEYRDYNSTTTQSDSGNNLYILLDFLRLRSAYDRVAWNLRPVILAHRVLVRRHRAEAAQLWRRLLHERLGAEANRYSQRLARLQKKYAVTLATVGQRIDERFLQPMTIDRMQSLVEPAIRQVQSGTPGHAFEILAEEAEILMRDSQSSGVNVPKWLAALEDEIDRIDHIAGSESDADDLLDVTPRVLSLDELQDQLSAEDRPD